MSKLTKTNENERVDGVTNSVQRKIEKPDKKNLEEELQKKFWEVYKSQLSCEEKIDEWNQYDSKVAKVFLDQDSLSLIRLKIEAIDGVNLELNRSSIYEKNPSGQLEIKKWHFSFPVLLKGKFGKIIVDAARFSEGLEIECDFNEIGQHFEAGSVFFRDVEIHKNFSVFGAKFFGEAKFAGLDFINCDPRFTDVFFEESAYFEITLNRGSFNIGYSEFKDNANFFIRQAEEAVTISFLFSNFRKNFNLGVNSGNLTIKTICFGSSVFEGPSIVYQMENAKLAIEKLDLDWAIFNDSFVIKAKKITNIPDFSKANFIDTKKLSLNEESWEVNDKIVEQEILPADEIKFRFLKKYFAEKGNHFKEREYFSYEMMAREKKLDKDGGADWLLFKVYKNLSNFGTSSLLPFAWLCFSCSIFFIISLCFGCDVWSGLTISIVRMFKPFTEFECSAQIISNSFALSFEGFLEIFRTENQPLKISNGLKIVSVFQSVINTTLIFLLILGLRNKFKIK